MRTAFGQRSELPDVVDVAGTGTVTVIDEVVVVDVGSVALLLGERRDVSVGDSVDVSVGDSVGDSDGDSDGASASVMPPPP